MSLYSANLPALLRAPSLSVTPPHPLPSEGPTGHMSLTGRPGRGGQRAEQAAGTCPGAHVCLEPPACPLSWLTGGGSGCQLVLTSRQAPPGLRSDAELCGAGAGISFPSRKDTYWEGKGLCAPPPLSRFLQLLCRGHGPRHPVQPTGYGPRAHSAPPGRPAHSEVSYVGTDLTRPSPHSCLTCVCDAGESRQGRLGGQPDGGGVAGGLASGF